MNDITALVRKVDRMIKALPGQIDIISSHEWHAVYAILQQACTSHPGAEPAIIQALATIDGLYSPKWNTIQEILYTALLPHLNARIAIAEALYNLDQH